MIVVPERYSYIEAYLTLRCNLACTYCINDHTGVKRKRNEISGTHWAIALNRLQTKLPITLGGGEPTIHPGFYHIVSNLDRGKKVDILTNGSFDLDEFTGSCPLAPFKREIPEYKPIRVSYHPTQMNPDKIVEKVAKLNERKFSAGIFGINHPENLHANIAMAEKCARNRVYFFVRDFLGYYDDVLYGHYKYRAALNGNRKSCTCRTDELLIGPCADVFRCHRDLYANEGAVGNLLNITYKVEDVFRPCNNYGLCNGCDLKSKSTPDLNHKRCSVEIKQ